jgi:hypothetical protein
MAEKLIDVKQAASGRRSPELRFVGGQTIEETAQVLQVS